MRERKRDGGGAKASEGEREREQHICIMRDTVREHILYQENTFYSKRTAYLDHERYSKRIHSIVENTFYRKRTYSIAREPHTWIMRDTVL